MGPLSPGEPWSRLWSRFVTRKNSGIPSTTSQRVRIPPATEVAEQPVQELRHTATFGRRVDVPEGAPGEAPGGSPKRRLEPSEMGRTHERRCKGVEGARDHLDLSQRRLLRSTPAQ